MKERQQGKPVRVCEDCVFKERLQRCGDGDTPLAVRECASDVSCNVVLHVCVSAHGDSLHRFLVQEKSGDAKTDEGENEGDMKMCPDSMDKVTEQFCASLKRSFRVFLCLLLVKEHGFDVLFAVCVELQDLQNVSPVRACIRGPSVVVFRPICYCPNLVPIEDL